MAENITLSNVVERLKAEGQLLRNTGTNSIKSINNRIDDMKPVFTSIENSVINMSNALNKLFTSNQEALEEQRRSNELASVSGQQRQQSDQPERPTKKDRTTEAGSGSLLGGVFGSIFSGSFLGNMFSNITSPLTALAGLVRANGPAAITVGLLYAIFRDIGENETFQAALTSIGDIWNNSIVPNFQRIRDSFNEFSESESFSNIVDFWNNFRISIQNFVSNTLVNMTNIISGTIEGVAMILEGEWGAGISRIINSLLIGIQDLADDALTAILELFGVDFGEDGSLLGFMDRKFSELSTNISNLWNNFITSINSAWDSFISFFTDYIPEKIQQFKTNVMNGVRDAFSIVSDLFSFGEEDASIFGALGRLTDIAFAGVNVAINLVRGIFGFSSENGDEPFRLQDFISGKIDEGINLLRGIFGFSSENGDEPFRLQDFISGQIDEGINWSREIFNGLATTLREKFTQLSDYISNLPDRIRIAAEGMFVDVSERVQIGFLEFGNWIGSIPARIKLMALSAIRDATSYLPEWAQIVSEADVQDARGALSGRDADLEANIQGVRETAEASREMLERRLRALDAMDSAALESARPATVLVNAPTNYGPRVTNVQGGTNISSNSVYGGGGGSLNYGLPSNAQ